MQTTTATIIEKRKYAREREREIKLRKYFLLYTY